MNSPKDTGSHCYRSKLYVGDILSIYFGNLDFAIVSADADGFFLETYDAAAGRPTGKTEPT